jgi:hypothetical protein
MKADYWYVFCLGFFIGAFALAAKESFSDPPMGLTYDEPPLNYENGWRKAGCDDDENCIAEYYHGKEQVLLHISSVENDGHFHGKVQFSDYAVACFLSADDYQARFLCPAGQVSLEISLTPAKGTPNDISSKTIKDFFKLMKSVKPKN